MYIYDSENQSFPYHGLSQSEARSLREAVGMCQNSGCDLTDPRDLVVDHDHVTGEHRGVICKTCNAALGHYKDSIERLQVRVNRLQGLIYYLENPPLRNSPLMSSFNPYISKKKIRMPNPEVAKLVEDLENLAREDMSDE